MNQIKIGMFIKELRRNKDMTQEQLADQLNVSRRTVSRWETGSNLPDLDIFIELSEYFGVGIGELFNGERSQQAGNDPRDTLLTVAKFSNEDKRKLTKRMNMLFICGVIAAIAHLALEFTDNGNTFWGGLCQGITLGMMIVGTIMTSRYAEKLRTYKTKLAKYVTSHK